MLAHAHESLDLVHVTRNAEVADGAQVGLLGLGDVGVDGVVVECDFLDTELYLAGFDLYTCLGAGDD